MVGAITEVRFNGEMIKTKNIDKEMRQKFASQIGNELSSTRGTEETYFQLSLHGESCLFIVYARDDCDLRSLSQRIRGPFDKPYVSSLERNEGPPRYEFEVSFV